MPTHPGHEPIEEALWRSAATGTMLDVHESPIREVPAELLYAVLTCRGECSRRPRSLKLCGARIVGELDLEGVVFACPLLLQRCEFAEAITLRYAQATAIQLVDCEFPSLLADQLETRGNFELPDARSTGEVSVRGAHIGGTLILNRAKLTNSRRRALDADRLRADQGMFCPGVIAKGAVLMRGMRIGGQVNFHGAKLTHPQGMALDAGGSYIERDLILSDGFTARGSVVLDGAHVGGVLFLTGAELTSTLANDALDATRLQVDGDVLCNKGFDPEGEVGFVGARIGRRLDFTGATLYNPSGEGVALNLRQAEVPLLILRCARRPIGVVDLSGARLGTLLDRPYDPDDRWPLCQLEGCTYDALQASPPVRVDERIAWLTYDEGGYSPQPYEQLASTYRRAGLDAEARRVSIAKERRRRRNLTWPGKLWSLFLDATVGHGYRLWQAGLWLVALLAVGTLLFGYVFSAGDNDSADVTPASSPEEVPPFEPIIYTLDLLVPVISFGQRAAWNAHGAAQWVAFSLTIVGWLLTTALVGGLVVRRQ